MLDAQSLHVDAIICDGHCDTLGDVQAGLRSLGERSELGHADLPRLKEGGVTAQVFACFVPIHEQRRNSVRYALQRVDAFHQALATYPDDLLLATRAAHIRQAKAEGKVAGILGLEGAEVLEGSLELLRCFHRLGVRVLGLTWNFRNETADGVMEGSSAGGLTAFGRQVVGECNRLGILVDVSHLAPPGLQDVLHESRQPIIASHSNARALCDHVRNLTDEQIMAIAGRGGLIGVTFVDAFLHYPYGEASLEHVLDQIDYLVQLAGPEHVMIGSDFDGATVPSDLSDVTRYPTITAGMLARGHSEAVVRQVMGLNFLRVFEATMGG